MSTLVTPGQDAADTLPVGRLRRAAPRWIGRLGDAPGVWLFIVALALASAAVFVTLILPMQPYAEDQLPWLFFVAAFGLAEVGVLHFSVRSQAVTVSLAEIPLVIGFYFADPAALVLAQLVGTAFALVVVRRQTPARLAFNLALFTLSSSLALVVFGAIAPPEFDDLLAWWLPSFAATSVVTLVGAPAIAVVISLSLRQAQPGALRAGLLLGLIVAAVNTSVALVVVGFLHTNPQHLWLVLAPAVVAMLGYRALVNQRERQARIEFLYDCARILARPPLDADPLVEMLTLARVRFQAEVAEVALAPNAGRRQHTRTVVGPGSAVETAAPIEGDLLAARMAMLPSGAGDAPIRRSYWARVIADRLSPPRVADAIIVPICVDDDVVGTLMMSGRAAHRGAFNRDDVLLLETLGVHTGVALQTSGLVEGLAESLADVTQLAAAVQSSDDAILAIAPDGTITAWNPAVERLFGYAADEIAGMRASVLVAPDHRIEATEQFGALASGQPVRRGLSEAVRKDGTRMPITATVSPITDPSGTIVGTSAIVHDETARNEAKAALREREEQFRSVFQLGPIGMVMVDAHRTWTAVNDALCLLLERRPDQLIGQRTDAFVAPDDVADAHLEEADLFASPGGGGYSVRRRYVTAGGRTIWARVTERPMWRAATGPGSTICVIEDITESRLAAERVRDTEARLHRAVAAFTAVREPGSVLRAVLAAARDLLHAEFAAIGVLSEDGSEITDLQFDGIDDATAAAIGRMPVGRGMMGLSGADTGAMRIREVPGHPAATGLPSGHPVISSFIAVPIVFEGRLVARLYAGNKQGFPEFDTDDEGVATALAAQAAVVLENARISARTLALIEELDWANAELRRANVAKSDFLGTVSHELRTPLHSILVAAELVSDPLFGPLTEERTRDLGATIQGSGRHLLGLIDDMVDLARIEADRIDLRIADVPLGPLLDEIYHEIEPLARHKGVALERECEPGLRIQADPLRIRQVLVNLLGNAVKFSERGGRVWIDASRTPTAVEIAVHDTGSGIRKEDLVRIFEPFEQVSGLRAPGAGLGLAIAKRLVDLHGGGLEVASSPGTGSTFTVLLPENTAAVPHPVDVEAHSVGQVPVSAQRSTILIVEDDVTALGLVSDLLQRSGYAVWQAGEIAGAMELLAVGMPSLVLLDIRLGTEDGLDVARRLRANPETRGVPILALSADAMQHDADRALEAGCDGHLAKPVVARELLGRIHELLTEAGLVTGLNGADAATSAGGRGA